MSKKKKLLWDLDFLFKVWFILFFVSLAARGQEYNFHFYNWQNQTKALTPDAGETKKVEETMKPAAVEKNSTTTNQLDSEKSKRTGIALSAQYLYHEFNKQDDEYDFAGQFGTYKGVKLGLQFISSYDFTIGPSFIFGQMDASIPDEFGQTQDVKGDVPGIELKIANKYWLSDGFALGLGAFAMATKGQLKANTTESTYNIKTFGLGLSAGPVIQLGKVTQLTVNVDYGVHGAVIEGTDQFRYEEYKKETDSTSWGVNAGLTFRM